MDSLSGPLSNIPGQIGIWKCGFEGWGKPESPGKNLSVQGEN